LGCDVSRFWKFCRPILNVAGARGNTRLCPSRQTDLCAWMSAILLGGLLSDAVLGWWWADSVAALVMVPIIVRDGLRAFRGKFCADCRGSAGAPADAPVCRSPS
jgi:hypothetical protein